MPRDTLGRVDSRDSETARFLQRHRNFRFLTWQKIRAALHPKTEITAPSKTGASQAYRSRMRSGVADREQHGKMMLFAARSCADR